MRVLQFNDKKLEKVSLPKKLIDFFKQVNTDIVNKVEATQIESDDLIQNDFVYGGLLDQGGSDYIFTYYPVVSSTTNYWCFILSTTEIKDIAEGKITTLNLWACQQNGCQNKFMNKTDTCFSHDYIDDGKPDPSEKTPQEWEKLRAEKKHMFEEWMKKHF
jgi:hypothetical protein